MMDVNAHRVLSPFLQAIVDLPPARQVQAIDNLAALPSMANLLNRSWGYYPVLNGNNSRECIGFKWCVLRDSPLFQPLMLGIGPTSFHFTTVKFTRNLEPWMTSLLRSSI